MPARHPHPRHLLSSLFTLGLVGLSGCDVGSPSDDVALRGSPAEAPVWSCLDGASVTLLHDDGTVDAFTKFGSGLAAYARPNDVVEVAFASNECQGEHGSRVTLVASTEHIEDPCPECSKVVAQEPTMRAWDVDTGRFGADGGALSVRLPECAGRIDLAFGEPLAEQAKGADYAAEGRSIIGSGFGEGSCADVPVLAVRRFEALQSGDGADLEWEIDADPKAALTVEIDVGVEGQANIVSEGQGYGLFGFVNNQCPECLSNEWRPELVVSDGVRRVWAAAIILE